MVAEVAAKSATLPGSIIEQPGRCGWIDRAGNFVKEKCPSADDKEADIRRAYEMCKRRGVFDGWHTNGTGDVPPAQTELGVACTDIKKAIEDTERKMRKTMEDDERAFIMGVARELK